MSQSDLQRAVAAYYHEEARRAARRGFRPPEGVTPGSAQPVQYDESGFPIPACSPSFAKRVMRLIFG